MISLSIAQRYEMLFNYTTAESLYYENYFSGSPVEKLEPKCMRHAKEIPSLFFSPSLC